MTITAAQLVGKVSIEGDADAKQKLSGVSQAVKETSGGFKSMLGGALSFAAGLGIFNLASQAVGFLKDQFADTIKVAMAHQDVLSQTAQVIQSTGGAAHMSAQAVSELAESLGNTTRFGDDVTETGENMLLTFTNIGKSVFPQATKTMLDMSQALGQDVKSSAIQLGKALNDPIQGITALSRVGVTFDDQQKKLIKTYMEHGDVAKAQGVILQELQREFGGSATAAGKTLAGALDILKNRFDEFKEKVGGALIPILSQFVGMINDHLLPVADRFAGWFAKMLPSTTALSGALGELKSFAQVALEPLFDEPLGLFVGSIQNLGDVIRQIVAPAFKGLGDAVSGGNLLANFRDLAIVIQHGLADALSQSGAFIDDLSHALKDAAPSIQHIASLMGGEFTRELRDVGAAAQQIGQWFQSSVVPALRAAEPGFAALGRAMLTSVIPAFIQIRGVVMDVIEHAFKTFGPIIEKIIPPLIVFAGLLAQGIAAGLKFILPYVLDAAKAIGQFADEIMDRVAPIIESWLAQTTAGVQAFSKFWAAIWPGVSTTLQGVWDMIVGVVKIAWSLVSGIIKIGLDLLSGNWKQAWSDLQSMLAGVWDGMGHLVDGGIRTVQGLLQTLWLGLSSLIAKPFQDAWATISSIFNQIQSGIGNVVNSIGGVLSGGASLPHHATGTSFAPGGLSMLGEVEPEVVIGPQLGMLPRGAQVIPISRLGGGGGAPTIIVHPPPIYLDGRALTQAQLPYIVDAIRYNTGAHI